MKKPLSITAHLLVVGYALFFAGSYVYHHIPHHRVLTQSYYFGKDLRRGAFTIGNADCDTYYYDDLLTGKIVLGKLVLVKDPPMMDTVCSWTKTETYLK